ncbi:DUF732 domain-containing protein [Mycobacterium simiae]|uniref:DUF732 domain-containing protein n=1 Tax=Mycobacterium simiae TaxID=1784 RepID=A0A5B1BUD8_MYCSI|nr:DUF732 domain-containing protein [Mycobacterium simiae]KAA1250749.1 DUF732 domain-containing protein [Mycobacterium simiae]
MGSKMFAAAAIAISITVPLTSAHADTVDSQLLGNIHSINYPSLSTLVDATPEVVVKTGRSVCSMLDQGYGFLAVRGMILDRLAMYGDNRNYYAGLFGVYAVQSYCPAHQEDSGFNGNY